MTNMKSEEKDTQTKIRDDEINENIEPLLSDKPDKQDEQIQNLSKSLTEERDARKEERLLWILVSVILLNVAFFSSMESTLGPLIIGFLQLIALTVVATRLGLEEVVQIIDRLVGFVVKTTKHNN